MRRPVQRMLLLALAVFATALGTSVVTRSVSAEPPPTLMQQGRVLGEDGRPLHGEHPATFRLYTDDGEGQPGELVYEENLDVLMLVDGYYAATIGLRGATRLPRDFAERGPVFVTLQLGENEELPAQRITAVPYAFVASHVEGSVDATEIVVGGGTTTIDAQGISTARLMCTGCVEAGALAANSVDSTQLADQAVQPEHVAGGVVNGLTRGQIYSRADATTVAGVGVFAKPKASCDAPEDIPVAGSCFAADLVVATLHRFGPEDWEDPSAVAQYGCDYKNGTAATITVEARIHCLDVTP